MTPPRGELRFRLIFSLFGLGLVALALILRGSALSAPALVEVLGVAGVFFGGSAAWSAWRLWKG